MEINTKRTLLTGNEIPIMGLGTWQLKEDTAEVIAYALQLGYRMIDTSSDYGTQRGIGEGIKMSGVSREKIYVVTKVEEIDDAYARTKSNLAELGLDYVELMLIHRPPHDGAGENLWMDLIKAKKEGLVRDIGVSNYSIHLIEKLRKASVEMPVVNQIEWSPFGYSREMKEYADRNKMLIQAYSPLTRTTHLGQPDLVEIAKKNGKTPAQILIRWNLQLGTIPIPKANNIQDLEENLEVFDFELSEGDMRRLGSLNEEFSALGSLPYA